MIRRRSGLGSLIPGGDLPTSSGPEMVPITSIAVNPYQPRRTFAPEALEELAESIRTHGILQPMTVRPREGGFELIAGERRLQAARKAGLTAVPVVIRECSDEDMLALALVENLQREDLNAMEAARSYQRLIDEFGMTQGEIAEQVGKSRPAVANTLRLLALPENMQQAVEESLISEGHARALLGVAHPLRQQALFEDTVKKGLSVRALEALAGAQPEAKPARSKPQSSLDPHLQQLQANLQRALSVKVRFKPGSTLERGSIEIEYYSADDLERIYEISESG